MCGRFTLITSKDRIREQFGVEEFPDPLPQFNIAPSLPVLVLVQVDQLIHGVMLKWGLIPFWANDKKIGNKHANARSETITIKPAFRNSFKSKRGLLIMSGFFEWQQQVTGIKQPYYFKQKEGKLFAIAALWDTWQSKESGEVIQSCCLLTTAANKLMSPIHNRMPVILNQDAQTLWLNEKVSANDLLDVLKPFACDDLESYPVSKLVNNSRYEGIDTIKKIKL